LYFPGDLVAPQKGRHLECAVDPRGDASGGNQVSVHDNATVDQRGAEPELSF
jgi:hypothetical protein